MTKKIFFPFMAFFIVLAMILAACGGSEAPAPASAEEAPAGKADYVPDGTTVHFSKVKDSDPVTPGDQHGVSISLSKFDVDDPTVTTPLGVSMTGRKGYETEGLNISFSWNLVPLEQPHLYDDFDNLCNFHWDIIIGGRPAIVQQKDGDADSCWVEFTYSD